MAKKIKKTTPKTKSTGLGDDLEKVFKKTGIKKIVKSLFGDDCGCNERKKFLNKIFPYDTECLNENEYNYLKNFNFKSTIITHETKIDLLKIYNRVFNLNTKMTSCTSCWKKMLSELNNLFIEFEKSNE